MGEGATLPLHLLCIPFSALGWNERVVLFWGFEINYVLNLTKVLHFTTTSTHSSFDRFIHINMLVAGVGGVYIAALRRRVEEAHHFSELPYADQKFTGSLR